MGYCLCKQQSSTPLPTVGKAGLRSRPGEGLTCHSCASRNPEKNNWIPACAGMTRRWTAAYPAARLFLPPALPQYGLFSRPTGKKA